MTDMIAKPPFHYDPRGQMIFGKHQKDGSDVLVCEIRGWGHLTGKGRGALGLEPEEAAKIQDALGEKIAKFLNHEAIVSTVPRIGE